ncbi:MAG: MFS transporter [Actinomycetota bacterium]|nr:MFS transporter [Actinomycetota bacterium]
MASPSAGAVAANRAVEPAQPAGISNRLVLLMAVATGSIVANLYYAQPLLHEISRSFHVGSAATSLIVTCTQLGYAAGLLLVVPLGDLHPRRSLTVAIFGVAALFLVVCAVAPSLWLFEVASIATGCASVAGQVLVPFAADLADTERRGRVVARIMTGLLLGILLARTVSGLVANFAGWRMIYWLSAALMALFVVILARALPAEAPRPRVAYVGLVVSSLRLLAEEPLLRRRAWQGAFAFAAFSVLWTSLAFLLSSFPYHYSNAVIGLFGLAGAAGVAAANLAGKLADGGRVALSTAVAAALVTVAFAFLGLGATSLVSLLIGIVVLDIGTQGMQITNQAVIYSLRPDARSRLNSAYMVCYFLGGALGSLLAGTVLASAGWSGVCALGAAFGALCVAGALFDHLRPPRSSHCSAVASLV